MKNTACVECGRSRDIVLFLFHKIKKVGESLKLVLFPYHHVQKVADSRIVPNIYFPAGSEGGWVRVVT